VRAALAAAIILLLVYREALAGYLVDQHYQEHFLYLWVFLGLALAKTLRGPFRSRFSSTVPRDRMGLALAGLGILLLGASEVAGSSTGTRTSLVLFLTGIAAMAVPAWTLHRCLLHGLLMLLCFGLPYAVWFPITNHLQWGVAAVIALPAKLGLASYVVDGPMVRFPHYELGITPDCSGLGQLLTFTGIAALGVLSSAPDRRRAVGLFALAVVLAWLSNLARVSAFVLFVAIGWTRAVDDPTWHALLGFLVFLPFVTALVWRVLRTHVPLAPTRPAGPLPGRWPTIGLFVLLLATHLLCARPGATEVPEPPWFAGLERIPGHRLLTRASTEASDRLAYGTPWLLNARFEDDHGRQFDLFHYTTRSRSHLCVHKVAACMTNVGQRVRYGPAILVDGERWWSIAFDAEREDESVHVYYAFEVGGKRLDDSAATQWEVFRQRLLGRSWEVRLTRVTFPGRLPAEPDDHARTVLGWLGKLAKSPS
jgi:exosortase/archaeosortase family protein